jgi:hypothetical protein
MFKLQVSKALKKPLYLVMALSLSAFTTPQKEGLVEIQGFLNARSGAKFRQTDQNRIYVLKPGTKGLIKETKYFPGTQNYGLCLEIKSATEPASVEKCVWVYYDIKNPALKLFSASSASEKSTRPLKPETSPEKAHAAQTVRTVTAVPEGAKNPESVPTRTADRTAPTSAMTSTDSETPLKTGLQSVDLFNRLADQTMTPSSQTSSCMDCLAPSLRTFETCSSGNSYLESNLGSILNHSAYSSFFQNSQKEIIRSSCIQRNMSLFPKSSAFFRICGPQQSVPERKAPKACISERYVDITSKAFNLSADCLGDYVAGHEDAKGQVALSMFSLMSLESGMHVNAMSSTGPGGPGQMSGSAITAVNQELSSIQEHLAGSANPHCSNTLAKALSTPMSPTVSCDRISIHKDNPLKSMAYAFAYQAVVRRALEKQVFSSGVFRGVLSPNLPAFEKERLLMEVSAWSHNTGPAGMLNPLRGLLILYMQNSKMIESASDVDQLLKDLRLFLASHAHPANRSKSRITETMNYYKNIQSRMVSIAQEPKSCLAN